jgi:hypothetical protein
MECLLSGCHTPGEVRRLIIPLAITKAEPVIRENCSVEVNKAAPMLDINHGSAHCVIHDMLQFHKVSAGCVPRQTMPKIKERSVDAC